MRARGFLALVPVALVLANAPGAAATGPPQISETWVTDVTATSANLRAKIDPDGSSTSYRFEYLTQAAYEAGGDSFNGATLAPPSGIALLGAGNTAIAVAQHAGSLTPNTAYRYRVRATNAGGAEYGAERLFLTGEAASKFPSIDGRGYELVSPADKDGGAVGAPESIFAGGDFQAAAAGDAFTFSSTSSFGEAAGAPPASQYLSTRTGGGWSTVNISAPVEAGGYGDKPDGSPFRIFSEDLGRALLLNPRRCEAGEECPRSYSLRESATGAIVPLPAETAGMQVVGVSPDLGRLLFEGGGQVYEWSGGGLVPSEAPAEPEPVGGIVGVLGASASGDTVYYQDASGLEQWRNGVITTVVAGADAAAPSDWPAATGTARVSADGEHLAFLSAAAIPPFDNTDANTGQPDTELYLYGPPPGGGAARLVCVSCNPSGERPTAPTSIPGAVANGSTVLYRPRVLSAGGNRVFFETADQLVVPDTDARPDVYEWEADGVGSCNRQPGCLGLISRGRGEGGRFLDASADGADAFFLTGDSLVGSDPGSIDVYDYRVGGGFPEPEEPIPCIADACQPLPSPPEDPAAGTSAAGPGNPPPHYAKERHHRHHKHRHRHQRRRAAR